MDIAYCAKKVEELTKQLQKIRENDFGRIFQDASGTEECNEPAPQKIRRCEQPEDSSYKARFSEILDNILVQIKDRLQTLRKLEFFSLLNCDMYDKRDEQFPNCTLECLENHYGSFFDIVRLKTKLGVVYCSPDFKSKPVFELVKFMQENKLNLGMPEVYKLAKLIVTIPGTTSTAERAFSVLKRNKCTAEVLKAKKDCRPLALMLVEKNLLGQLKKKPTFYDDVTAKFIEKSRRVDFIFK